MSYQNTEYRVGNATFMIDRVFDSTKDHCKLITDAIMSEYRKNRGFDNPNAACYNQNVSERFF